MKANELRIGNYLSLPTRGRDLVAVEEILKDDFVVCDATSNEWPISDYKPIHLTEEWFLKFGFDKSKDDPSPYDDGEFTLNSKRFTVFKKYPITHNSVHGWFINNANFDDLKIQYVHQLQNLYFALTGEELTIQV